MTDAPAAGGAAVVPTFSGTLRRDAATRVVADVVGLVTSFASGAITARWLEPDGKGVLSTLVFFASLAVHLGGFGLGDALIYHVASGRIDRRLAVSASTAATMVLSVAGAVVFVSLGAFRLGGDHPGADAALLLLALSVPVGCLYNLALLAMQGIGRISGASALSLLGFVTTFGALVIAVIVLDLGLAGAAASGAVGTLPPLIVAAIVLRSAGAPLRPRWNGPYLRGAVGYGGATQFSYLLMSLAGRVDLPLVLHLAGESEAGQYSVALSYSASVAIASLSLTTVSFPRLAAASTDEDVSDLTSRLVRAGLVVALALAAVLAVLAPVVVPFVFGRSYDAAVAPAIVLMPGYVLWVAQLQIARAAAARGAVSAMILAFGSTIVVTVGADLIAIPAFGVVGAAVASDVAMAIGTVVALAMYKRAVPSGSARAMVPRPADVRAIAALVRGSLERGWTGVRRSPRSGR